MVGLRIIADLVAADAALENLRATITRTYVDVGEQKTVDPEESAALKSLYLRLGKLHTLVHRYELDRELLSLTKDAAALITVPDPSYYGETDEAGT